MVQVNGTVIELNGKKALRLITENINVAKRFFLLAKDSLMVHPRIVFRKSKKLKEHNVFIVTIDMARIESSPLLSLVSDENTIRYNKSLMRNICCKKAYLRGIFLASGSITNPSSYYHVELVTKDQQLAKNIRDTLARFMVDVGLARRKSSYIVYIKDADKIIVFLNLIGAHKAQLDLENVRILKEMRNSVNRLVNCETANLSKVVDASVRQIGNIKYLQKIGELDKLPEALNEVAHLRLQYPDASLKELGQMLTPTVGKSGINHRLKKIDQIAQEYKCLKEDGND